MKFIAINGSTCSGKSSVIKRILKERDHLFALSYDSIKRSFSKYAADTHFGDVHRVMLSTLAPLGAMRYDIISDSGLHREWRHRLFEEARAQGYEVVEINLEAAYDVLAQRFDERVEKALANPEIPITNLSKERFTELHDIYQREKNPTAHTFQTDKQSIEEIASEVLQIFAF